MKNINNCNYCGKFVSESDYLETDRIYGVMSPDCDIVYHKSCKKKQEPFYCENNSAGINCFSQCNTCKNEGKI